MTELNANLIGISKPYEPLDVDRMAANRAALETNAINNQYRQAQFQQQQQALDADAAHTATLGRVGAAYASGDTQGAINEAAGAGAFDVVEQLNKMTDAQRKSAFEVSQRTAPVLLSLKKYPAQLRPQVLASLAPQLIQDGLPAEKLQALDLSDNGLDTLGAHAMTIEQYNSQQNSDRTFAAGRSDHADTLKNEAANRGVTIRGQDIGAASAAAGRAQSAAQFAATQAAKDNAMFDPQTVTALAQQALEGDKSVFTGLGRGTQGSKNIALVRAEMTRQMAQAGMSGKDIAAKNAEFNGKQSAARTMGNTSAKVDYGVNELTASIPLAVQASQGMPRGTFVPLTKVKQLLAAGNSDPKLKDFAVKTQAVINAYNLVAARAGSSVGEREHNTMFLSTATSPAAYQAALDAMAQEAAVAKSASKQTMGEVTGTHTAPAPKVFRYDAKGNPIR